MRIVTERIKRMCAQRGVLLGEMLMRAGISRNAYYTLARRDEILPGTCTKLTKYFKADEMEFLTSESREVEKARVLQAEVDRIVRRYPDVDPDNVRHTLILLREKPVDRLRRALIRAQGSHFRRG